MSGPGAVQLFIPDILSQMSAIMMVTGSCSMRLLWSALRSTSHQALVLCDASFSRFSSAIQSQPGRICSCAITLPLRVYFEWFSGEHPTFSSGFCYCCVSLQLGSQSCEPLLGSLQCLRCGQFVVFPRLLFLPHTFL